MGNPILFLSSEKTHGQFRLIRLEDNAQDELALRSESQGPYVPQRAAENQAAAAGNSLYMRSCVEAGASKPFLGTRFRGIAHGAPGESGQVTLDNYPSAG